jgi:ATP-dependent phosphoenolpyruvate carboxykinase
MNVVCHSPYGVGKRIDLPSTRNIIHQILNGEVQKSPVEYHPIFNVNFPTAVKGVNPSLLNPRKTWASPEKYDETAKKLAGTCLVRYLSLGCVLICCPRALVLLRSFSVCFYILL